MNSRNSGGRNWGDHPVAVAIAVVAGLMTITVGFISIYTFLSEKGILTKLSGIYPTQAPTEIQATLPVMIFNPTLPTSPIVAANQTPVDFSGTWLTNFATVTLQQVGNQASGTYQGHGLEGSHELSGNVEGNVLEGHFKGKTTNLFRFTISDDMNSFDGDWSDDGKIFHQWCGVRTGVLPDGCGYSGRWKFSSPLADSDAYVVMYQSGAKIEGNLFFNSSDSCQLSGEFKGLNIEGVCNFENGSSYIFKWRRVGNDFTQFQGVLIPNGNIREACGWRSNAVMPLPCSLE